MPFEDKRSALLQILPDEFRRDMFMKLFEMQDSLAPDAAPEQQDVLFDRLKNKVSVQAEQIAQWGGLYKRRERPANSLESSGGDCHGHVPGEHPQHDGEYGDGQGDLLYNGRKGKSKGGKGGKGGKGKGPCLLYTSPSPRDQRGSRMPSSA